MTTLIRGFFGRIAHLSLRGAAGDEAISEQDREIASLSSQCDTEIRGFSQLSDAPSQGYPLPSEGMLVGLRQAISPFQVSIYFASS